MQRLLSACGKLLQKSLVIVSLMLTVSLGLGFALPTQPSFAADLPVQQEPLTTKTENREQAYEEAVEAIQSPKGLDKEYEENLEAYKEDHPGPSLVETAQKVVEKVTGQE